MMTRPSWRTPWRNSQDLWGPGAQIKRHSDYQPAIATLTRRRLLQRRKQFGWNVNHTLAVERLKLALAYIVQLSYPNEEMIQCVFCDASYNCSSGMVTRIPNEDSDKSVSQQRH